MRLERSSALDCGLLHVEEVLQGNYQQPSRCCRLGHVSENASHFVLLGRNPGPRRSFHRQKEPAHPMLVSEETILKGREELLAAIADDRFPCVGAKSAMARG